MGRVLKAAPESVADRPKPGIGMWQHHGPDRWIFQRAPNRQVEQRLLAFRIEINGSRAHSSLGGYLGDSCWPISMLDKDFRRSVCDMVQPIWRLWPRHDKIISESYIIAKPDTLGLGSNRNRGPTDGLKPDCRLIADS